ncbi:MAG: phosphate acyltransferase PlsX [Chloroflexi bacterium]|nr:phosphate acyltransferase PlsX [Chloroflexota bacterium]
MLIAVDAGGVEPAPHQIVGGVIKAAHEYGVDIALVGSKSLLHVLAGRSLKKLGISIIEASQVIAPHESPMKAVRSKPDSSIVVGVNLVRDGVASAFISAGNTGAVVCAALLNLGKIPGVERPALASIINLIPSAPVLLMDAGANIDCRPSHLVQFSRLGSIYVREVLGISSPRVGLLSNGAEETKGTQLVQKTYKLLKKTDLNFIGSIEGHDILKKAADVIITDGFTGNIVLKTIEGISDSWLFSLRQAGAVFAKAYRLPSRALHRDMGIESWAKRLDYREYGGVCLLGVNGNIIKAHGRSQAHAIKNAIGTAKRMVEQDVLQKMKEGVSEQANGSA